MVAPTMLIMPFPSPEEKYPQRIVIADITKEMEIILSAGMPSNSISELAENNCSNCPGKHRNTSEKTNEDGSIVIEIKKQYNSSTVGEYLN